METVVLHSDIARLVLGYLKRQNLERASRFFCKSSPHLRQEFSAYKKGFMAHSFFPELEEIICEYVNITNTVDSLFAKLPTNLRTQLQGCKLSKKVKDLLERALQALLRIESNENSSHAKVDSNINSLASTSHQSDKENSAKKLSKQRCKRLSQVYSSDEYKNRTGSAQRSAKRRRVLEPFCYLSMEQRKKQSSNSAVNTSSTCEEQSPTTEDENELESVDEDEEEDTDNNSTKSTLANDTDVLLLEKPAKESTPHTKQTKSHFLPSTVPEGISQAILDNPTFQMRLVDNINQALQNSSQCELSDTATTNRDKPQVSTNDIDLVLPSELSEEQQVINSNQMLDQMVKEILAATEKDPTFDAIVKEVADASLQPSIVSAGVQCNLVDPAPQASMEESADSALPQQHMEAAVALATQQQISIPCSAQQLSDILAVTPIPPRTPLIIRTAVAAANASLNGEHQVLSTLTSGNSSFGSLIDPNFSISKLIVLNSNDSAQKHPPPDQNISNTAADQLINQLTNGTDVPLDEQVFFDANTGQLTIPLLLTDEGLLANFPFLINNETVSQQLQTDNIVDCSRIEIPLPEPIIVTADQFPPNSIIVTSAQKATTEEEQQQNQQKQQQTVIKKSNFTKLPSSLDIRSNIESGTPAASGIVNAKAFKSLSTPRKRTSHVRTLTFSPKAGGCSTELNGDMPIESRKDLQKDAEPKTKTITEHAPCEKTEGIVSEKPIIKNVEILPRLTTNAATADMSANESSNSCSVPFAHEESSNQTVIKSELSIKDAVAKAKTTELTNVNSSAASSVHTDTPKRKQVRRTAVRACKRQISKSSDDDDKSKRGTRHGAACKKETGKPVEKETEVVEKIIQEKDKMMEEWVRLRSTTNSDLDSRLRQLNAQIIGKVKTKRKKPIPKARRKTPKKTGSFRRRKGKANNNEDKEDDTNDKLVNSNDVSLDSENIKDDIMDNEVTVSIGDRKRGNRDKQWDFNIKIPTPQKEKRESSSKSGNAKVDRRHSESTEETVKTVLAKKEHSDEDEYKKPIPQTTMHVRFQQEHEKRTANIACLLDTPFKEPNTSNAVPPTPGVFVPSLNTPYSKVPSSEEVQHSSSYLFGSLTKSDLETPQLSAITPGLRFATLSSSRDVTPRSANPTTDYSSGGSYYKPDESDDLDRNIDRMLRDSTQKRQETEQQVKRTPTNNKSLNEEPDIKKVADTGSAVGKTDGAICVEIPAEQLKVEPIVLKRVKSFGSDLADNTDSAAISIDPHYTLASELPEICAAEEESSNSSSTFSSSSSSSSSSSNSSSSSSSSNATGANASEEEVEHADALNVSDNKEELKLSLDNLSNISSTEDEEWQKLAVTEEENSQLVSNDGEVRYPVRSWLTPKKSQSAATATEKLSATIIKVTLPLKSAEKRSRLEDDLRQKRERILKKLKLDSDLRKERQQSAAITSPGGRNAALKATRRLQAMHDGPKATKSQLTKIITATTKATKTTENKEEKRHSDVLKALNLSAKKQSPNPKSSTTEAKARVSEVASTPGNVDDNTISTVFTGTNTQLIKVKTETVPLKSILSSAKLKQRRCVQIDALPTQKCKKKIVRKPLGFKGTTEESPELTTEVTISSNLPTIPMVIIPKAEVIKPILSDSSDNETSEISPVPKFNIKQTTGMGRASTKLRISPRLRDGKKCNLKTMTRSAVDTKTKKPIEEKSLKSRPKAATPKPTKITKQTKQVLQKEPKQQKVNETEPVITVDDKRKTSTAREKPKQSVNPDLTEKNEAIKIPQGKSIVTEVAEAEDQQKPSSAKMQNKDVVPTTENVAPTQKQIAPEIKEAKSVITTTPATECATTEREQVSEASTTADKSEEHPRPKQAEEISEPNDPSAKVVESSEEDPNEGCELTSITETDKTRFISLCYDGPDKPPEVPLKRHNFSNFKVVVTFDEYKRHIWTVTDDIVLLDVTPTAAPNEQPIVRPAIRNIPKKRKVRLSTTSTSDEYEAVQIADATAVTSTNASSTQEREQKQTQKQKQEQEQVQELNKPMATSTPMAATIISAEQKPKITEPSTKTATTTSKETKTKLKSTTSTAGKGDAPDIQMDDIESLLSHLHGKPN